MDEIESIIETIIHNKTCEYINKYLSKPKYVKIPLWVFDVLKRRIKEISTFYIDYQTERFTYKNLIICETITIEKVEEIEVF